MLIAAKILLTLTDTCGYALVTIKADFNIDPMRRNPKWIAACALPCRSGKSCLYAGVGLVALYLVWIDGPRPLERLYHRGWPSSAAIYGGFFLSVFSRCPMYSAALYAPTMATWR